MRPSVFKALALDALKSLSSAFYVLNTESRMIVVLEVELCEVTEYVLLSEMLVGALYAAPEHREVAFNRVRVELANALLALAVVAHRAVSLEMTGDRIVVTYLVVTYLVGYDESFLCNVLAQHRLHIGGL
jgi:hypothetical protein